MDVKESYRVLELEIGATRAAMDDAYCRLIERWHPDRAATGGPEAVREAQRMVQAINDAYHTLAKIAPTATQPAAALPAAAASSTPSPADLSRRAGGTTDAGRAAASNRGPGQTPANQPRDGLGTPSSLPNGPTGPVNPAPAAPGKPTLKPLPPSQLAEGRPPPPPPPEAWAAKPAPVASLTPPPPPAPPPAPPPTKSLPPPPAPTTPPPPVSTTPPPSLPTGQATSASKTQAAQPTSLSDFRSKATALYDLLFPLGSPRRRFGPAILAGVLIFVLLLGKCAFSSSGSGSARGPDPKTTGRLLVKSNVANALVEAMPLPVPGSAAVPSVNGTVDQLMAGLRPGKYDVTTRADGWPDAHKEVNVEAGRTTEAAINFSGGSLRLDSDPEGATVRQGETVFGRTPLVIPLLPPGECQVSVEYPTWPAVSFKTTITVNVEASGTVRLPHGKLMVNTNPPGAMVLLGGRPIGQTPLTLDQFPAGTRKLTLQAKNFPPLDVPVTVEDHGEVTVSPALGSAFPVLDPAALLRNVWVPDDPDRISPPFDGLSGPSKPQNGVIRNLNRKKLYENWLRRRYCFTAVIKSYDRSNGQVEFAEEQSDLAKYRVLATLSTEARNDQDLTGQLVKGATFAFYGRLGAVEEGRWLSKVITFEFSSAEPLR